jgi:nucleoside-diphosphate-sugar epimerase
MKLPSDMVRQLRAFYEGRPVCVTGGAGFIGGHLCDALVSLGADVAVIDDLSNSTLDHLAELIELEPDRVRFVDGSILDDEAMAAAARGAKTIFHLAAIGSVPRSVEFPHRTWMVNATGTLRVLEAARAAGCERVMIASSSSIYGDQPQLPKVETQSPSPLSPYAASKLAAEHLLRAYSHCHGLSTVALRYFNIFGPRQRADSQYAAVIPAFAKLLLEGGSPRIFGDGGQTRDFTFVSNAVLATLLAGASRTTLRGDAMNIASNRRVSVLEATRMLAARCGVPDANVTFAPERPGEVRDSFADVSLASKLIGYAPIATLEQGLDETVAWHKARLQHAAK